MIPNPVAHADTLYVTMHVNDSSYTNWTEVGTAYFGADYFPPNGMGPVLYTFTTVNQPCQQPFPHYCFYNYPIGPGAIVYTDTVSNDFGDWVNYLWWNGNWVYLRDAYLGFASTGNFDIDIEAYTCQPYCMNYSPTHTYSAEFERVFATWRLWTTDVPTGCETGLPYLFGHEYYQYGQSEDWYNWYGGLTATSVC